MEKISEIRVVYVTTRTFENARQIAKIIVTERLAACCSIVQNVFSIFGWQESIHERNEYLMIIKTSEAKLDDLEERVLQVSLDDVPEILAMPVESANKGYHDWLLGSLE